MKEIIIWIVYILVYAVNLLYERIIIRVVALVAFQKIVFFNTHIVRKITL